VDLDGCRLMSRSGDITLELGGEDRTFRLAIGQWRKVQEKCDAGPAELLTRLAPVFSARQAGLSFAQTIGAGLLGSWRIDDVREVILQGLLGANMAAPDAQQLVREWVDERPLLESVAVAYEIVMASVIGAEDEKPAGEQQAARAASPNSHEESSASERAASTPTVAPSDGTPEPLTP
jgi:hypothetical protein